MEGCGSWSLDFCDFNAELDSAGDGLVARFGNVHGWAARNGARPGTPLLVGPSGVADARVNLFFRVGTVAGRRPRRWRRYGYSLLVWLDFLTGRGRSWDAVTMADFDDFRHWRMTDHRNVTRVRATSFSADRAALNSFYRWAGERYGLVNPVPAVVPVADDPVVQARDGQRDPARPAGAARRQVKWLLRPAFEQWRDAGLRGFGFGGQRRAGGRGFNEDRGAAFAGGLYGTGPRLAGWSSVLDVELPGGEASGWFARAWLAAACIKGGREGRCYRIPRSVMKGIAACLDPVGGSRAEAIGRARRKGRCERVPGKQIVTGCNRRGRTLCVLASGGSTVLSLDLIAPGERLRLFRQTLDGLEPLAVWLGNDGMPRQAHSWEKTFQAANARIARAWAAAHGQDPAAIGCPLWARPPMARHCFALRWFSILSVVWEQRLEGFTEAGKRDLREQFGDVWFQLATLLGHSSPEVTRDWYLEPFTGLHPGYIMSLPDAEEHAAIGQLAGRVARGSDRVLGPARPDAGAVPGGAR